MGIDSGTFNPALNLKAGADFAQGLFVAERKARQYNALREIYGDAVGPDDSLSVLDANNRANQKLPGELEGQSLTNKTAAQNLAYNALANPERLAQLKLNNENTSLSNDYNRATQDSRVQVAQQAPVLGQQRIEQNRQTIRDNDNTYNDAITEKERNAAQGVIAGVKEAMANGESPEAAFDRVLPQVAAMEGIDPSKLKALRQKFIDNPQATIAAMETHMNTVRPNTALMRAQADQQRAANKGAGGKAKSDPETIANALDLSASRIDANVNTIDRLMGNEKQPGTLHRSMARSGIGRTFQEMAAERGLAFDPGSYGVHKDIDGIKHSISITDLENIKDLGLSLGRVTNVEFQAAANALESLDPREEPERTAEKLRVVRAFLAKAGELKQERARRTREKAGVAQPGGAAPADAAAERRALIERYKR